ncbi:hypothetical protein [Vulcanisaeta sp. JCM 16159]|uniref:hypothetical protein n=1 Tax=Vulcanisaeta sp. JCM 16159 TaxID=1295371 RepID=UPI0006D164EB|nr:hypothetical protein [Vulcanisaeta sp. JCM 16159]
MEDEDRYEEEPENEEINEESDGGSIGSEDYLSLIDKAPEWSVGVILYNGNAYPLAKSKYKRSEYYFSPSWRPVAKNVNGEVVVLRDGKVSKYKISRRGDKYLQVVLV